jgi:hypothetical protein
MDDINSKRLANSTTQITIYISKAFDAITCHLLLNEIYNTSLHNSNKRWLANYLSGRHAYIQYYGKSSNKIHFLNIWLCSLPHIIQPIHAQHPHRCTNTKYTFSITRRHHNYINKPQTQNSPYPGITIHIHHGSK